MDLHVTPYSAPCPLRTFRQANFDTKLLNEILAVGYETPTAIQAQAIPIAMSGYDVIGLAKTGTILHFSSSFCYLKRFEWIVSHVTTAWCQLLHKSYEKEKLCNSLHGLLTVPQVLAKRWPIFGR